MLRIVAVFSALVLLLCVSAASQDTSMPALPRLIRFSGTIPAADAVPRTGTIGLIFSLYKDQTGGAPLWQEAQNLTLDAAGRYSVLLGANTRGGLPAELFTSNEARWLGVQVEQQLEQPRVLLVSVPYALKAGDAETFGGKPPSAFVLAAPPVVASGSFTNTSTTSSTGNTAPTPNAATGSAGFLSMFTTSTDLGDSVLFQSGANIGVNTTAPAASFHSVSSSDPGALFDVYSNVLGALPVVFRAARGTPASPSAVQIDDILGGLAVRAYGATAFSSGRGQVMFRAAENWTDTAQGTSLQFTTTPIGTANWVERMRIDNAGNVGIGTSVPTQRLSVAGAIESTSGGFLFPDGSIQTSSARARGITFLAGCDTCGLLADSDSEKAIYVNVVGAMTLVSVACYSDAGNPVINIQRNTGTAANILNANLTCSPTGASSNSFVVGQNVLNANDRLDFAMVTAGGQAHRITVVIQALLN